MDPFTEKLLERTRARRENLQRKMAERPTAANRQMAKRLREPLAVTNSQSDPASDNVPPSTKPSPSKRRCSDDKELSKVEVENVEPPPTSATVPALSDPPTDRKPPPVPGASRSSSSLERKVAQSTSKLEGGGDAGRFPSAKAQGQDVDEQTQGSGPSGIRSRLQRLAEQRQYWDSDAPADVISDSVPVSPIKTQRQEAASVPDPAPTCSGTPLGRRGRLANLAVTIGSWEDELGLQSARRDNVQAQPGTACVPVTCRSAPTAAQPSPAAQRPQPGQASASKPVFTGQQPPVGSPVKPGRVALPSPQKSVPQETSCAPLAVRRAPGSPLKAPPQTPSSCSVTSGRPVAQSSETALPSSPRKTGPATAEVGKPLSQSPLRNQSPAKDLGLGRDVHLRLGKPDLLTKPAVTASCATQPKQTAPLQQSPSAGAPGGPGVKSFLERFGERCQERSIQNSPSTPSTAHSGTPRARLVQERLKATPVVTNTADIAHKQRLERENELEQLRNRFQKGNMWKTDQNCGTKLLPQPSERDVAPSSAEEEPTAPPVEAQSIAGSLTGAGDASPVKTAELSSEKVSEEIKEQKSTSLQEIEMNMDEVNSSEVINKLFDGVLEDSREPSCDGDEESDEEREADEDALNISSMSLLTPVVETVAAVTKSPQMKLLTSTPASSFNEKSRTPDSVRRSGRLQRARIRRTRSSETLDGAEDEQNLPYSVDAYRSTRVKETARPAVKQVIVRKEDVRNKEEATPAKHVSVKQKIKDLTNEMNLQQTVIHQASQALNCCTDEEHGKGSQVEAEAERLLLIATEKRVMLKAELDRLKAEGPNGQKRAPAQGSSGTAEVGGVSASKGSISLLELRLPLKADFVCTAASRQETTNYYFFIMIRAGSENTVATPLASTRSALSGDALTFSTSFTLPSVSNDFEIDVEVYCLVQKRELYSEKKKKASKSKAITPKRLLTSITKSNLQTPVMASPGGPNAVRTSSFVLVGSHKLTLASIGKTKFPLEKISYESIESQLLGDMFQHKVPFLSPLEGHIYLKLQCEVGSQVEERGFLTMFEDVSGFGAWHRRWCVLSGYCISYWTYPDDEKRKHPIGRVNLANCTSRKVDPANREFCARPNTFELITVRPQRDDDKETLVSRCKNTMCVTKYWLSADTKDERNLWMRKLNQILVDLRMWQPDSCYRPV